MRLAERADETLKCDFRVHEVKFPERLAEQENFPNYSARV